ncbi:MAG: hypothetical protein K2K24_00920, partial [Clostridia bacterium]|nr:hypothetical protein [Clostridia bacterium]
YCKSKGYDCEWLEKRYAKDPLFVKINERLLARADKESESSELREKRRQIKAVVAQMLGSMPKTSKVGL